MNRSASRDLNSIALNGSQHCYFEHDVPPTSHWSHKGREVGSLVEQPVIAHSGTGDLCSIFVSFVYALQPWRAVSQPSIQQNLPVRDRIQNRVCFLLHRPGACRPTGCSTVGTDLHKRDFPVVGVFPVMCLSLYLHVTMNRSSCQPRRGRTVPTTGSYSLWFVTAGLA